MVSAFVFIFIRPLNEPTMELTETSVANVANSLAWLSHPKLKVYAHYNFNRQHLIAFKTQAIFLSSVCVCASLSRYGVVGFLFVQLLKAVIIFDVTVISTCIHLLASCVEYYAV